MREPLSLEEAQKTKSREQTESKSSSPDSSLTDESEDKELAAAIVLSLK